MLEMCLKEHGGLRICAQTNCEGKTMTNKKTECKKCKGKGWYNDHSDEHRKYSHVESCEEFGCPIQRSCENCKGGGK